MRRLAAMCGIALAAFAVASASAGAAGFALSGTGTASVMTAPLFRRGVRYTITVDDRGGRHRVTRAAGSSRRLQITMSLGSIGYTSDVHLTVDR